MPHVLAVKMSGFTVRVTGFHADRHNIDLTVTHTAFGNHGFTMVPSAYPGLRGGKEEVFSSVSRQEGAYIYSAAIGLIEAGMKDVRPPSFETNDGQLS